MENPLLLQHHGSVVIKTLVVVNAGVDDVKAVVTTVKDNAEEKDSEKTTDHVPPGVEILSRPDFNIKRESTPSCLCPPFISTIT
jgi:hypothetical protein